MKTITALEFRKNMGDVLARVSAGEEFLLTYRNSNPVRLVPQKSKREQKAVTGLDALNSAPRKNFKYDSSKSIKQLYGESLDEKYNS
ncbi:MAG: hypothetical protein WAS94_02085 [Candidatus Saccharimonadales bacterium]|jgi:antitoxin (DNA-binding transcriptional repressor) of toxin-antitoxin stability system